MTITFDAQALGYAAAGCTFHGADLVHAASDPFDLAHLATTTTFGSSSFDGEDEDEDEDESAA